MKDLDKNIVYSLENIKKDEDKLNQLKDWLIKNDKGWDNTILSDIKCYSYIYYREKYKQWDCTYSAGSSICALTLFENVFIPNTVIEVSHNGIDWQKRVLVMVKNDRAICWQNTETIEEASSAIYTAPWKYYQNIPAKTILTKQQIAKKFKLDINLIEIKDE